MGDKVPSKSASGSSEYRELTALLEECRDKALRSVVTREEASLRLHLLDGGCLLGMFKHLIAEEHWWFEVCFEGREDTDPMGNRFSWEIEPTDSRELLVQRYRDQIAKSKEIAARGQLEELSKEQTGKKFSLRSIMLRMIAETSEHAGQIAFVSELI